MIFINNKVQTHENYTEGIQRHYKFPFKREATIFSWILSLQDRPGLDVFSPTKQKMSAGVRNFVIVF